MRIIFTENEVNSIVNAINTVGSGIASSCRLLGENVDELTKMIAINGINDETIAKFNEECAGLIVISKNADDSTVFIDFNEEYVIATTELTTYFIDDFFDVIKYGIKTFIAFGAVKFDQYKTKIKMLLK